MSEQLEQPQLTVDVGRDDHIRGPAAAPLTLVEYGDYECPYCGAAYPIVKEIERILGAELRSVFRNFPLSEVHPHAFQAAEAAESAAAQGRFWEMHDRLYENQKRLRTKDLLSHAEALGLDPDRIETELQEHVYEARVRNDFLSGIRSGVNGTPTFFINGIRHNGSYDLDTLLSALRTDASNGQAVSEAPQRTPL
ncbi:MAG: disulfide bond formation protein DsbA [Actinobacteria bacterium]|nr:MAG: disulfide bond formation protein DsbA [Actinomycetota bacterium]